MKLILLNFIAQSVSDHFIFLDLNGALFKLWPSGCCVIYIYYCSVTAQNTNESTCPSVLKLF